MKLSLGRSLARVAPGLPGLLGWATLATVPAAAQEPSWFLSFGAAGTSSSNVRLRSPEDPGDLLGRVDGSISHVRRSSRGEITFKAEGDLLRYQDLKELNRFTYTGGASASYRLSSRAALTAEDHLRSSYTYDSPVLTDEGILLPLTLLRANRARAGLTYVLSSRTSAGVSLRHDRVNFGSSPLVGSSFASASATLSRRLHPKHSLVLSYAYERRSARGRSSNAHTVATGWNGALGPRVTAGASAGVSSLQGEDGTASYVTPYGSAGLTARSHRSTISARYLRSFKPAFGFGRDRLTDTVAGEYSLTLTRRLMIAAVADHIHSRDPFDPVFTFTTDSVKAELRQTIGRRLSLSGSYALRRRDRGGDPVAVMSERWTVSAQYVWSWR